MFLIAQHGKLIFEKYYTPYGRNKLQRMFSVTKSFTSLAIEWEDRRTAACDYFLEYPGECILSHRDRFEIEKRLKNAC